MQRDNGRTELESVTAARGDPYFVANYKQFRQIDKTSSVQSVCLHWKLVDFIGMEMFSPLSERQGNGMKDE